MMNYREATLSDLNEIIKVNVDTWKNTYQGIISEEYLQSLSYNNKETNWRQRLEKSSSEEIIYLAETDSKEIVGFAFAALKKDDFSINLPQIESFTGQLCAIYVIKDYQRKNIGTQLVKLVVKYFLANNVKSMMVWVLKENPSRIFYKKLGGKFITEQPLEIGRETYIEIAYGWENIEVILLSC